MRLAHTVALLSRSRIKINNDCRYGTADAGKTVYCEEPLHSIMKVAADLLNLQPHYVGAHKREAKYLYSAADIEVDFSYSYFFRGPYVIIYICLSFFLSIYLSIYIYTIRKYIYICYNSISCQTLL